MDGESEVAVERGGIGGGNPLPYAPGGVTEAFGEAEVVIVVAEGGKEVFDFSGEPLSPVDELDCRDAVNVTRLEPLKEMALEVAAVIWAVMIN